jgi:hypothetical protein
MINVVVCRRLPSSTVQYMLITTVVEPGPHYCTVKRTFAACATVHLEASICIICLKALAGMSNLEGWKEWEEWIDEEHVMSCCYAPRNATVQR